MAGNLSVGTLNADQLKSNTWLNPDGTENFKCRAWCNFNGTGTPTARASGNIGSILDNGVGDYTLNFIIPMPSENYSVTELHGSNSGQHAAYIEAMNVNYIRLQFTSDASNSYPAVDPSTATISIIGG